MTDRTADPETQLVQVTLRYAGHKADLLGLFAMYLRLGLVAAVVGLVVLIRVAF